jgi:hypothetical protein
MFSSYLGTVLENTLLKEREKEGDKWLEDEEEGVSSNWMILRKAEDTGNGKRKH